MVKGENIQKRWEEFRDREEVPINQLNDEELEKVIANLNKGK